MSAILLGTVNLLAQPSKVRILHSPKMQGAVPINQVEQPQLHYISFLVLFPHCYCVLTGMETSLSS